MPSKEKTAPTGLGSLTIVRVVQGNGHPVNSGNLSPQACVGNSWMRRQLKKSKPFRVVLAVALLPITSQAVHACSPRADGETLRERMSAPHPKNTGNSAQLKRMMFGAMPLLPASKLRWSWRHGHVAYVATTTCF